MMQVLLINSLIIPEFTFDFMKSLIKLIFLLLIKLFMKSEDHCMDRKRTYYIIEVYKHENILTTLLLPDKTRIHRRPQNDHIRS